MHAGAIVNTRIRRVFYGARDRAMGACGGVLNLFMEDFPHHPQLVGSILAEDRAQVLSDFFKKSVKRNRQIRSRIDKSLAICENISE